MLQKKKKTFLRLFLIHINISVDGMSSYLAFLVCSKIRSKFYDMIKFHRHAHQADPRRIEQNHIVIFTCVDPENVPIILDFFEKNEFNGKKLYAREYHEQYGVIPLEEDQCSTCAAPFVIYDTFSHKDFL